MDLQFDEPQQLLAGTLARYLERTLPFEVRRQQRGSADFLEFWKALDGELGIANAGLDGIVDGFGGGPEAEMIVAAGLATALAVTPYVDCHVLAGALLSELGQNGCVNEIASGDSLVVVGLEEAQTYGNPALTECWAEPVADGWRFSGAKLAIPFGGEASLLLVPAQVSDGEFALFALSRAALGNRLHLYRMIDDTPAADLSLDGFVTTTDNLLAQGEHVLPALHRAADRARAALCAEASAIARVMLDDTVAYAKDRKQFGVTLASFQALQHRMVDMYLKYEEMAAASLLATLKVGDPAAVSAAKATCAEGLRIIGQEAVQLHGAMGLTEELRVGHYFKRATVLEHRLGGADMHIDRYRRNVAAG